MYIYNMDIYRIHEKAFRSDLSTQTYKTSPLLFPVIYLYLVTLLHFFYDGVGVNSHSTFSLCTIYVTDTYPLK